MTKRRRRQHRRPNGALRPILRPAAWSALVTAAVAAALATPAYADPPLPNTVPDTGARPIPAGQFQLPGATSPGPTATSVPVPPSASGPLAAAIYAKEIEVATLGDQLLRLGQDRDTARAALNAAELRLRTARDELAKAQEAAARTAADALKDAAALPPGTLGSDLHGLGSFSRLQRGIRADADTEAANRAMARARDSERMAYESYLVAETQVRTLDANFATLEGKYKQAEASLLKIKQDNAAKLAEIEREREELDQRIGSQYPGGESVAGLAAHPKALAAVQYALAQLGDPYEWAAEGPDSFDCSGLMWAAYRSAGYYDLPRVSRDQYYATRGRTVSRNALLPGDLLFFASGSSWTSIHHVGMYIGNGKMVHAPTTGDVVKVSPVWWSRFYAATRVIGAVPAPTTKPPAPPKPKPTPTPKPAPKPTPTPIPKPTPPPRTPPTFPTQPSPTDPADETTNPDPTGGSSSPSTSEPSTSEPSTTEPSTTEPSTSEPSTSEPSTTTSTEATADATASAGS